MIFATIDAQLSFGRLVQMVDEWTGRHPEKQIFVLSGDGRFTSRHCQSTSFTSPGEWERLFQSAGRVISHAGIGTIIKSLEFAKSLVPLESPAGSGDRKSSPSLEMLISKIKRFAHDHC